jgi:cobalt-zinc-cadmium efflux system protein
MVSRWQNTKMAHDHQNHKSHKHNHGHSHCGHSHLQTNGKRLFWAIVVNVLLTLVQVIGGVVSGSVSLMADALHNFSDAGSLIVAYFAQRISGKPANQEMTYGYGRAEILGALINSVSLILVGFYLLFEAWKRFLNPQEIDGWIVVIVASLALIIDVFTAWLTYKGSKDSINMRAAFLHNLTDALASVVVIISGILIILFDAYWVDFWATILISVYIVWHSWGLIKTCIKTLMQAVPEDLEIESVVAKLKQIEGVQDLHHTHLWSLHDQERSFESHVRVSSNSLTEVESIKLIMKKVLLSEFKINHSTLEFEHLSVDCEEQEH